jgi:hypothetical protein
MLGVDLGLGILRVLILADCGGVTARGRSSKVIRCGVENTGQLGPDSSRNLPLWPKCSAASGSTRWLSTV